MNINIDIEKLVVEGMSISPSQGRMLQAAVEAEMSRLLSAEGLPDNWQGGGAVSRVPSGTIQLTSESNTTQMGQQIAQAVYRGMQP